MQQLMSRKHGLMVRHVSADGYHTEVVANGEVVHRTPDDCLASNSIYVTRLLWRLLYKGNLKYAFSPAYTYLPGKNVVGALMVWNRDGFEKGLLPVLKAQQGLQNTIETYQENRDACDEGSKYALYDSLVRMYVFAREHNLVINRDGISGYEVVGFMEGFTNSGAECISLEGASGDFITALKAVRAGHVEREFDGKSYLVKERAINAYEHAGGKAHVVIPPGTLELLARKEVGTVTPLAPMRSGVVDGEVRNEMIRIVANILGQNGNPASDREIEVHNYHRDTVKTGLIGKNSLLGLGNVAGEGELGLCLDRIYREIRKRLVSKLTDNDCMKLAASRLASMNSVKVLVNEDGVINLRSRLVGGEIGKTDMLH